MAEPALPSPMAAPVRRRRRHCVVVTPTTRRRRQRQIQMQQLQQRQQQLLTHHGTAVTDTEGDTNGGSGDEYLVEKILGERYDPRIGRRFFRVRWQGYSPEHDTWEPEPNLAGVREFVEAYRRERSARMQQRLLKRQSKRSGANDEPYRRRMGSWEYVPTSELVAKKTRFFDDLAEGRIDVRSDDLYSRVKCRRRQAGTDDEMGESEETDGTEPLAEKENVVLREKDAASAAETVAATSGVARARGARTKRERAGGLEQKGRRQRRQLTAAEAESSRTWPEVAPLEQQETATVLSKNLKEGEEEENKQEEVKVKSPPLSDSGRDCSSGGSAHLLREPSSDISPPELSPVTPVSPKSPTSGLSSRVLSPAAPAPAPVPKLPAPTSSPEADPKLAAPAAFPSVAPPPPPPPPPSPQITPPTLKTAVQAVAPRSRNTQKVGRKPRPPHTVQRRRLVQKVSPNMQPLVGPAPPVTVPAVPSVAPYLNSGYHSSQTAVFPPASACSHAPSVGSGSMVEPLTSSLSSTYHPPPPIAPPPPSSQVEQSVSASSMNYAPPPPPPPMPPMVPIRVPSPAASSFFQPPAPPSCIGAPSIRPEILEKMIDDCMSQNHIPDVNPLLSYMVDDAKTPPPGLVSVQLEWADTERELIDSYLQISSNYNTIGMNSSFDTINSLPHLRPLSLPCGTGGRVSNVQLRVAVLQNNYSLVRALLSSSANHSYGGVYDLEQRDGDGESLLARCVRQGHRHMAELLLQFGAMTESPRQSDGATPLMLAVDAGQYHLSRLLLDNGASPDHQNRLGETCLHRAVRRGHSGLVDLIWRRGVDFARVDAHMQTALKCARSYPLAPNQPQIERMLVSFMQTHNHQLNVTCTSFLASLNLEAESHLYPPNCFLSVAHCPHNLYRFQLQVPNGTEQAAGTIGAPTSMPLMGSYVLLLVHALPDHPSLFWLEEGPCVVESVVLNGTEQRRFGHHWFLSSLYPLMTGAANDIEIRFTSDMTTAAQFRNIRLIIVAMKVRPKPLQTPNLMASHQQVFTSTSQVHRSPIGSMPAPTLVSGNNHLPHSTIA